MKNYLLGALLLVSLVVNVARAEVFAFKSAKIVLNPEDTVFQVSALFGTTLYDLGTIAKIPAQLVLEGENETLKINAIVSVPKTVGVSLGYAGTVNSKIKLKNLNGKKIGQIFGKYKGSRSGIAAAVLGISYFSAKNENEVKMTDWDYRFGLKLDLLTRESLILESIDDTYGDIELQQI